MKRRIAIFAGVFALLLAFGIQVVEQVDAPFVSVKANPYGFKFPVDVPAPDNVNITIRVTSPMENASFSDGTINFCFNETINQPEGSTTNLNIVTTYQGDWMSDAKWSPFPPGVDPVGENRFLQYNFNVSGIPAGERTLNIVANGHGDYNKNGTEYTFNLQEPISVKFYVNSSAAGLLVHASPNVSFLSFQNGSSTNSTFPLTFTVDRSVPKLTYCLDGQDTVSIRGNITLTGLSNGQHNITVSATDTFGYVGTSGILFKVGTDSSSPSQISMLWVLAPVFAIALTAVSLIVYFKRMKGKQ